VNTILAIAGLAALFVVFGVFRPGARRSGCGNCSCEGDSCRLEDEAAGGPANH